MKYLLLLSLLIPSLSHADSVTSGIGLIIISTGVADPTRNYGDKINENMRVIAATITNINTSISNIAVDSTTLNTKINTFNNFNSTGDTLISNLLTWTTTATTRIDQHQVNFSTIANYLTGGALAVYDEGTVLGNATTIDCVGSGVTCTQSGTTTTLTIAGGGGAVGNSTFTKPMGWGGYILLSTNTVCPFPKACFWTGNSTLNVVDIQGAITFGSTVAMTSFQIVESSGGVPNVPAQLSPAISRFPRIDVSTATSAGKTSMSTNITTGVVIPAYTWVGVQVTTTAVTGTMPQGFEILINMWKKPYGGN